MRTHTRVTALDRHSQDKVRCSQRPLYTGTNTRCASTHTNSVISKPMKLFHTDTWSLVREYVDLLLPYGTSQEWLILHCNKDDCRIRRSMRSLRLCSKSRGSTHPTWPISGQFRTTPGQKATRTKGHRQKATANHLRVYCPVRQTNPLCELSWSHSWAWLYRCTDKRPPGQKATVVEIL